MVVLVATTGRSRFQIRDRPFLGFIYITTLWEIRTPQILRPEVRRGEQLGRRCLPPTRRLDLCTAETRGLQLERPFS